MLLMAEKIGFLGVWKQVFTAIQYFFQFVYVGVINTDWGYGLGVFTLVVLVTMIVMLLLTMVCMLLDKLVDFIDRSNEKDSPKEERQDS